MEEPFDLSQKPSSDGNSPYGLLTADQSAELGQFDPVISQPLVFLAQVENKVVSAFNEPQASIDFISFQPDHAILKAELSQSGSLVFVQNTNPHWQAYVDGENVPIEIVNQTFSSVRLTPGIHEIEFKLEAQRIRWSFIISLMFAVGSLPLFFFLRVYEKP